MLFVLVSQLNVTFKLFNSCISLVNKDLLVYSTSYVVAELTNMSVLFEYTAVSVLFD